MTPQSLYEQVAAARLGSREAFAALVGHYQGLVSATTLNIVGDFQQSEDIAQETFLIAWNRLTELSEPAKFPAWLCGIARNCSKNWLRRQERNPLAQSTELVDIAEKPATEMALPNETDAQLVWQSLAEIPETYREPMLMFYRHGTKISDIADALELTEEAVRQRLSRGRKLLKSEVERIVEKTLSATRPDTAFTLAVLSAIPLSATVGCQATTKSIGLLGGATTMSYTGIIGLVVSMVAVVLLSVTPTLLLAVICFYAFWYAVKNSPTLRTRRFLIGAALDLNVLLLFMWFVRTWFWRFYYWGTQSLYQGWWSELIKFLESLHYSVRLCLLVHLPEFLVFSIFITYIVLRWRWILYEDKIETQKETGTERSAVPGEPSLLAKTLEREINFVRNLLNTYRNPTQTASGLHTKRNIAFGLIAVFLTHYIGLLVWAYWQTIRATGMDSNPNQHQLIWFIASLILQIILVLGVQAGFLWVIAKAIGISRDEADLEQTPPNIPLAQWSEEELQPARQRQMLADLILLMGMIPLMLILIIPGSGFVREIMFPRMSSYSVQIDMIIPILLKIALVVLTVLWCSHNPKKRMLGFSRLFLFGGWLAFGYLEFAPLMSIVMPYLLGSFMDWVNATPPTDTWNWIEMFFVYHLSAGAFLFYSLLMSAVCYFLQPRTEP